MANSACQLDFYRFGRTVDWSDFNETALMNHPLKIESKEIPDLVRELVNLRYDVLADFLSKLGATLIADGKQDSQRGREQLSRELQCAGLYVNQAAGTMYRTWRICAPHMQQGTK